MKAKEFFQRLSRRIALVPGPMQFARKTILKCLGARVGQGTIVPRCAMPWPHQVSLGKDCRREKDVYFKYDGYWTPGPSIIIHDRVFIGRGVEFNIQGRLEIGNDCLIASGCVFIDHDHGTRLATLMNGQPNTVGAISVGKDVWIGANCVILKNVQIGDGAIIGAGSVVTKSVLANEIWAGNPARKIRSRGDPYVSTR